MADILKVSTPLLDKLPPTATRPVADPSMPFDLSDVTKVIQTTDPSEILQQNTGFVPQENETPKILTELLKDPAVAASIIRNLHMLEEIIDLLPANNTTLTQEVEQLFNQLILSPEEIATELVRQEDNTTIFKGELFDQLRDILLENPEKPEIATSVGVLLKSINATVNRQDAMNSVANNLKFVLNTLQSTFHDNGFNTPPRFFEKIETLITKFSMPETAQHEFPVLKQEVAEVLKEVENSILYSPALEKTLPLITYNLSRYNDNEEFMPDALKLLLSKMEGEPAKLELVDKLQDFINRYAGPGGPRAVKAANGEEDSQVMSALSKLIGKHAEIEDIELLSGEKLDKIVHSMLSSPSNFTPLLHFIVPVEFEDMRAFAEIWIDPDSEDSPETSRGGGGDATHMLMVFDVDGMGRFETDMYVNLTKKRISLNLACPPAHFEDFKELGPNIRRAVSAIGYTFDSINIDLLTKNHSLMEIFRDLPYRRTGIDVKV